MALLSDRAGKTSRVVVLPASLEDPSKSPPGMYRLGLLIACGSILAFFAALVVAFYWRSRTPPFWAPITLPRTLWLSTAIILMSSVTFEAARRTYRRGLHHCRGTTAGGDGLPGRGISGVPAIGLVEPGSPRLLSGPEPLQLVFLHVHRSPRRAPDRRLDRAVHRRAGPVHAARNAWMRWPTTGTSWECCGSRCSSFS